MYCVRSTELSHAHVAGGVAICALLFMCASKAYSVVQVFSEFRAPGFQAQR